MNKKEYFDFAQKFFEDCVEISRKKNADYTGGSNDPFSNFTSIEVLGIKTEHGFLTRMFDKMKRISSFVENGELQVKDESVLDTLQDLANYSCLFAGFIKSRQKPEENQQAEKPVSDDTLEAKLASTFQESNYYIPLDNSHFTEGDLLLIENWYDESASSIWCTIRIADFLGEAVTYNAYKYTYTVESTNAPAGYIWSEGTVVKRIL